LFGKIIVDFKFDLSYISYMETNEIKFTTDEVDEVTNLNAEYQSLLLELGEVYLKKIQIEEQQSEINSAEDELRGVYSDLQKRESTLSARITKKYGPGRPDFARGMYLKDIDTKN
tara:strand:+ start:44619 stop:44963 length:345 start_codon:yes stop_codon:yes gene_type:complete